MCVFNCERLLCAGEAVMMKCLYLLSVVFQMAAGCVLEKDHKEITQHKGDSVLLPCSCSDLHSKPQTFTWEIFRTGRPTEVLNDEHYRGRYQLFNNTSPANLSLLISDLREEDQGVYRCSTEKEHRDFSLYVKGCELVKKTVVEKVTGFIGESVVLPCVCTDLQDDPKRVTWEFNKNNHFQEIYSKQTGNHSNRVKLVSKNPPGDLSLLISDLTEEDQGNYRCSVQADYRDFRLYVKGRRETSTEWIKTDTITSSEQTRSKPTTSPPASFSTTQGGRRGEKVNVEGHQDCEGRQEDQVCTCTITVLPDIFLPLEILLCL
ncbi:junctional adhesion molecule-like isoform X2 [Silurus meridionalis]|uniref:junctional adhesion molecule-like isoform X2 n=1 Tax=Silurus meridionalis TaxID=175797 RepID=UPI001EEB805B|nr:junctional adhesion molecule-like isoform X2 [Silurus meridionalis]